MKKGTIISLIVAAALILGGAAMLTVGLSVGGGNTYATNIFSLEERKVTIDQTFESVVVETGACDVTFVPFDGNADAHIVFLERVKLGHDATVRGGVLEIEMTDHRQWMDYIGFGGKSMEMTIYLPRKQYESLQITTDTGDIQIPEVLSAKRIQLRSDTGDILCEGAVQQLVDCETDTGDITVENCAPGMLKLQTDTGDMKLRKIGKTEVYLQTNTGDVDIEDVNSTSFTCESNTGDVTLRGLMVSVQLKIVTDTGDVQIEDGDANIISIETDTGDIRVPKAWQKKGYLIETDTGKIRFE